MSKLKLGIENIKGIGKKKKELLSNLGIHTIEDIIYYFPVSYEDRRHFGTIKDSKDGELVSLKVEVKSRPSSLKVRRNMTITKVLVSDGTENAYMTFFNQSYRANQFSPGDLIYISGKIKNSGVMKEFNSPEISKKLENSSIGKIEPIYGLTKGISNKEIIKFVKGSFEYIKDIEDIPEYIKREYELMDMPDAIENLHFPENRESYLKARNTLAFDELITLQLGLLMLKGRRDIDSGFIEYPKIDCFSEFKSGLPFKLTGAQKSAVDDIESDMESKKQMNRLVQGDVGSGKTVIAMYALFKAFKSEYQGAMMAPTEILARQHYESLKDNLEKYGIKVGILVSNMKAKEKRDMIEKIKTGEVNVVVGTHALIEDYVEFKKLGIVITDEQHRFGVNQRARLSNKSNNPDILVMTATPIPRTLALIVYGDLDITVIDELPPGRKPIMTYGRRYTSRDKVYDFIRKQIRGGRQAYVVCPMVEDSDIIDLQSADSVYSELSKKFYDIKVGLLHGQMKGSEKDEVMEEFKSGKIDILVSTTVIEVGVNVPNANVMVVENAERFGLAQLHQLRGRVGRGSYQSYCILLSEGRSDISRQRIRILEETNDGFIISEKDLELRGPGEFFGFRQHGIPELKVSKLPRDMKILSAVQSLALSVLGEDSDLQKPENRELRLKINNLLLDSEALEFN